MITGEQTTDASVIRTRQGHRLLQIGTAIFLFALFVGLTVQKFTVPRLGLSVHLLGLMQGLLLAVMGLLWPKLALPTGLLRTAFWLIVYGCLAALAANFLAAIWGAGNALLPMAAGPAHGGKGRGVVV